MIHYDHIIVRPQDLRTTMTIVYYDDTTKEETGYDVRSRKHSNSPAIGGYLTSLFRKYDLTITAVHCHDDGSYTLDFS